MKYLKKIVYVFIGKLYWSYLVRINKKINNSAIILIPLDNGGDEEYAVELVGKLIEENKYDNAVFLSRNKLIKARLLDNNKLSFFRITKLGEESLKQLYLLDNFDSRFYYAATKGVFRRNSDYINGINGLDRRKIFGRGIYKLSIKN